MELAGSTCRSRPATTTIAPAAPTARSTASCASSASERAGLPALRPWREALADYLERAGLLAGARRLKSTATKGGVR